MAFSDKKFNYKKIAVLGMIFCVLTVLILLFVGSFAHCSSGSEASSSSESSANPPSDPLHRQYGQLADTVLTMTIGDSTETLTIKDFADWITVSGTYGHYTYTVDSEKVSAYTKALADKYNNYKSHVTFTTAYGEKITLDNNTTGWIFDDAYAASVLEQQLVTAQTAKWNLTDKSPESNRWWTRIASDYDADKKKGDCYAEVSIADQYMWLFKKGKVILEGPVVTGNPNTGNDTPKGAYIIYEKNSPATLYGPGYITEVSYWMAFIDDIGFHDAEWQESFGGDNYLYNGSHGCVNLPVYFAEALYQQVYPFMPVYVY